MLILKQINYKLNSRTLIAIGIICAHGADTLISNYFPFKLFALT